MNPGIEPNTLLRSLPPHEREILLSAGSGNAHRSGDVLYRPGEEMAAIYFPRSCAISVTTEFQDGRLVESVSIGREGVSGLPLFLGAKESHQRVVVQVPGEALRVPAAAALAAAALCPVFRTRVNLYTDLTMSTMSQSGGCLAMHTVPARCARWLLETRDRVGSEQFHLTQEFLAAMLGTHRPTVTLAAGGLQDAGLIRYHRGEITIIDGPGLEAVACECYGVVRGLHTDFASQSMAGFE